MKNATELVWDCNGSAIATSGALVLSAGASSGWNPVALLVTAAGVSLFDTFMELTRAADLPVLGYVSRQRADVDARGNVSELGVMASISVPSYEAALRAQVVWTLAVRDLRTLACPISSEPCIVVLSEHETGLERRA